jgi:5-methylcytosine-specific restriction endonuclease McrA
MEREASAIATDGLEQRLLMLESAVAVARAEQAVIVAELDRRQVPTADGCRSMAEWLTGRLTVSRETARSLTGLSRSGHPAVGQAMSRGEWSFDLAVETARLADLVGEGRAVEAAVTVDVAGLRRLVARHRRMTRRDEQDIFDGRHFLLQPTLDRSGYRAWGMLSGLDGSVVERALFERADTFPPPPDAARATIGGRLADALVSVCEDSLSGDGDGNGATVLATVFVDAAMAAPTRGETGAETAAGPRVGPLTLEQILCGGTVEVTAITPDGVPLAYGRRRSAIPPRLRRYILHRDGGCVADGCTSRYRLQPHHLVPWSEGGRTDPDNLATLCWFHHHVVVHRMGYRIDPTSPAFRRRFLPPGHDPP